MKITLNTMVKKRIQIVISLMLFALVLGLNLYIRSFPAWFPELKKRAASEVKNEIRKEATQKVEKAYPDFNPLIKRKLTDEIVHQKSSKPECNKKIEKRYRELKDPYQDSSCPLLSSSRPLCRPLCS